MTPNRRQRSWQDLSAFPFAVSRETARFLDTLGELVPIEETRDRKTSIDRWLDEAVRLGVATPDEAALAGGEVAPTLHERPEPIYLAMFANGDDDLLYEEGERARTREALLAPPDEGGRIRLASGPAFAVVRKTTRRTGVVTESNVLPKGAVVRSRVPWPFAVRPRNGWSANTFVAPRTLEVLDAPPRRRAA
jgi:hypothetical protein